MTPTVVKHQASEIFLCFFWRIFESSAQPHESESKSAAKQLQRAACHIKGTCPLVDSSCHHGINVNNAMIFNGAIRSIMVTWLINYS